MAVLKNRSYRLGLIGNHGTSRWHDLRPSDVAYAHPTFQKPSYHVYSVIGKRTVMLMHAVGDTCNPASRIDRLDISFDELSKLLRDRFSSKP